MHYLNTKSDHDPKTISHPVMAISHSQWEAYLDAKRWRHAANSWQTRLNTALPLQEKQCYNDYMCALFSARLLFPSCHTRNLSWCDVPQSSRTYVDLGYVRLSETPTPALSCRWDALKASL